MPLLLPQPKNELEVAAFAVIGELQTRFDLSIGAPPGAWVARLIERIGLGQGDRNLMRCAAITILRYQPQPDKRWQWAILSAVSCSDPAKLSVRAQRQMNIILAILVAMLQASMTPTGLQPAQFKLIANDLVRNNQLGVAAADRLTLDDLELYRRCYLQLRQRLFGA